MLNLAIYKFNKVKPNLFSCQIGERKTIFWWHFQFQLTYKYDLNLSSPVYLVSYFQKPKLLSQLLSTWNKTDVCFSVSFPYLIKNMLNKLKLLLKICLHCHQNHYEKDMLDETTCIWCIYSTEIVIIDYDWYIWMHNGGLELLTFALKKSLSYFDK